MRNLINRHHVIPRSRGGWEGNGNVVLMDRRAHAALHEVFGNSLPTDYLLAFKSEATADFFFARIIRAIARNWGLHRVLDVLKNDL